MPDEKPGTLLEALLAVQTEATKVKKTATNPAFKSKYVTLEALMDTIMPILNKYGLVWLTFPASDSEGRPVLRYELNHVESTDCISASMPLLLDKQNPQGMGSALTYARRQSLMAVVGIVGEEDDDGNKASRRPPVTEQPTQKHNVYVETLVDKEMMSGAQLQNMWNVLGKSKLAPEKLELILAASGIDSKTKDVTIQQGREIRRRLEEAEGTPTDLRPGQMTPDEAEERDKAEGVLKRGRLEEAQND